MVRALFCCYGFKKGDRWQPAADSTIVGCCMLLLQNPQTPVFCLKCDPVAGGGLEHFPGGLGMPWTGFATGRPLSAP